MNQKKIRFKELISEAYQKKENKEVALLSFKSEISEARSYRFSFRQITDFLKQVDIEVSTDSVRRFCQAHLNEVPRKRNSKKKKLNDSMKHSLTNATKNTKRDVCKEKKVNITLPLRKGKQAQ